MKLNDVITEAEKTRLDPACWDNKKIGNPKTKVKGGVRVNNCVPKEGVEEASKDAAPKMSSQEKKLAQGALKGAKDMSAALGLVRGKDGVLRIPKDKKQGVAEGSEYKSRHAHKQEQDKAYNDYRTKHATSSLALMTRAEFAKDQRERAAKKKQGVAEGICSIQEANEIFDDFERSVAARGLTEDIFDSITDEQIIAETAAWRRKEGKSAKGGLNAKGVASYRRENPGSKLQMAVTTKPSKLKKGSKAAKRRKSFCARMGGVKGPMKKPNGDPTRKALSLRKWNC